MNTSVPQYHELFNTLLDSLFSLGGSGSNNEIYEKFIELGEFEENITSILHTGSNEPEISYRLNWAKTYLHKYGFLERSSRGVWSLTKLAREQKNVDPNKVIENYRKLRQTKKNKKKNYSSNVVEKDDLISYNEFETSESQNWKDELINVLTMQITPEAFERLTQRLLRESGFVNVEVTGRSGDGGIDGKGIARIHGFMSFHVYFQCKKYQGAVPAKDVRDFRGAMVGRADKGLFITTSNFSSPAKKEATRDGTQPIDLIDGEQLADKLKEFNLGVKTELREEITIDKEWFTNI